MRERYVIYDLESLANFFSATFMDYESDKYKCFVICEWQNDLVPLMKFLRKVHRGRYSLVGYNCLKYDSQLLEFISFAYDKLRCILRGELVAEAIYNKSQYIINLSQQETFYNTVPEWNLTIPHIDIFKQKHYDGKQKSCSLKWLEFTMRMRNIQSMPFKHYDFITESDIPSVLDYNVNDVRATKKAFIINKYETDLRNELSDKFNLNLLNASEPKLSRDIFGHQLADKMHVDFRWLRDQRTYREMIVVKDLVLPYIKFNDPTLKDVLKWFKSLSFNPDPKDQLGERIKFKGPSREFIYADSIPVIVGTGGIHACVKPGVYESHQNWEIRDIDGKSFYPNIAIKNRLHPEHLPEKEFCDLYEFIYNDRAVIPKEDPVNYVYKIILNAIYGQSKEFNNLFCDPQYAFTITVNGQLLLLKLAELIRQRVPADQLKFYQFNTDGITIGYNPVYKKKIEEAMRIWENHTKIELEDKFYKKIVIVDVNNYLAVDLKGKIKRKGLFGYSMDPSDNEMFYHKDPSMLIVPKALEKYFVEGVPVDKFIQNHDDIYDFCIGTKANSDFNFVEYSLDKEEGKVNHRVIDERVVRVYVSKEPRSIKKKYKYDVKMKGRMVELVKEKNTTFFNIYMEKPMPEYNIDYQYYILETKKIINNIQAESIKLKLFN